MTVLIRALVFAVCTLSLACTSTQPKDRTPSGQAVAVEKKDVTLVQIVKLESEQRALYMLEDTEQKKFSVAECIAPRADDSVVLQRGATCTLISDQFVPDDAGLRKTFDEAFTAAVQDENKILRKKYKVKSTLGNIALGTFVGLGAWVALDTMNFRSGREVPRYGQRIFMPRMIEGPVPRVWLLGVGAMVGGVVIAGLEMYDAHERAEATIESDLIKRAPGISKADAKEVALESYAAIRRCLIAALNFRQST